MIRPGQETAVTSLGYQQARRAGGPALRIGLCSSLSWGFLRDLVGCVGAEPEAPSIAFLEARPGDVVKAVGRGEADVGFVYGLHDWERLQFEELWREPVIVVMPDGHRLARDSDVAPEALREETFLVAGDLAERDMHMDILTRAIGRAPFAVEAMPVERTTLIDLVSLGFGLALTTSSTLGAFHPGVVYRPIAAPVQPIAFHAVWRRSNCSGALMRLLARARARAVD